MAYSTGAAPVPPPPLNTQQFSSAYRLSKDSRNQIAENGVAPVNQMTNGFGGRTNADPTQSSGAMLAARRTAGAASGGNRTSQHVATPGNNNVAYRGTGLNTAQSLWQQGNKPGMPAPVNGMSMGFMKNTSPWGAPAVPPPPPVAAPPAAATTTTAAPPTGLSDLQQAIQDSGGKGTESIASATNITAQKLAGDRTPYNTTIHGGRTLLSNGMYAPLMKGTSAFPNGYIDPTWSAWMKAAGVTLAGADPNKGW